MGIASQSHRELEFISPLGKDVLLLSQFNAKERLGRPFTINLTLRSTQENIDFEAMLGQNVSVRMDVSGSEERHFNGIVSKFAQGENSEGFATYHATLKPWLWLLKNTNDCRIFQEQSAVDIIESVLQDNDHGDYELRLGNDYRRREYTVQYNESDLNFISRLMEEEGIYYFFEHEEDSHKLILCDGYASHKMIPAYEGIPYYPPDATTIRHEDIINNWKLEGRVLSGSVVLNDYNFKLSQANIKNEYSDPAQHQQSGEEIYDYPGKYTAQEEGRHYARIRQEALHASYSTVKGKSSAREFTAGGLMQMIKHPRDDQNTEYLITEVKHNASLDAFGSTKGSGSGFQYKNKFKVIKSLTPYRSESQAKHPKITGSQHAHVVGPKGEEIYCDEFGRVKVQFPWDRYGKSNEVSSCWIRVSQNWAGGNWGHMAIPRIGHEVIVEYMDANPDRPIIMGRTYHDKNKVPYPLPANKTRMTIKSQTHKGSGYNELRFEDENDQEEVYIHAQKDQNNVVLHDETTKVFNDRTENIGNDETISIGHDRIEIVGNDETINIGNDQRNTIGNDQTNTIVRNRISLIEKDEIIKISNHRKLDVYADQTITTGGHHSHQVGGKAELKTGEFIKHHTQTHTVSTSNKASIKGAGGSIVLDGGGISFKGNIKIKGTLAITSGNPNQVESLKINFNRGKAICLPCLLQQANS